MPAIPASGEAKQQSSTEVLSCPLLVERTGPICLWNFLSALSFSAPSQVEGSWSDVAVGYVAPLLCLLW